MNFWSAIFILLLWPAGAPSPPSPSYGLLKISSCSRRLFSGHCCLPVVRRDLFFLPLLWTPLLLMVLIISENADSGGSFFPTHTPRKPDLTTTQIRSSWYPPPSFPRKPWCHKQGGKKCNGILARLNHRTSVWRRSAYSTATFLVAWTLDGWWHQQVL